MSTFKVAANRAIMEEEGRKEEAGWGQTESLKKWPAAGQGRIMSDKVRD